MMYITECDYKWEFIIRLFFTLGAGITGDDIQVIIYMNCIEKRVAFSSHSICFYIIGDMIILHFSNKIIFLARNGFVPSL